ncbi:MAG TPA: hypothetical protein VM884_08305 [Flavisolibacter sp.]|jgi:hypothetical protein|nr:hypothetical protein [Flavisolibacter sp.]
MKNLILSILLFTATFATSQPIVQPVSSGDYWKINDYKTQLPELANTTFPTTINFPNGYVGISSFNANRVIGVNEIYWNLGAAQNVSDFYVEFSRDLRTFERAGIVQLARSDGGTGYVFRHTFIDNALVYYRLAIVTGGVAVAYTPAIQLLDNEHTTKVFPTIVKGSTFYIQTAQAYEKLQVINSANVPMYEKGINNQTGTITIGLPSLPTGIYFVRLLHTNKPQYVERVLIE